MRILLIVVPAIANVLVLVFIFKEVALPIAPETMPTEGRGFVWH